MPQILPEIIDELEVETAIRQMYNLSDADMELPGIDARVGDLIERVDQAQREGHLIRYARTNATTGNVTGHCYKREELVAFLSTQPGFRRIATSA
jgi:hypothetical protein